MTSFPQTIPPKLPVPTPVVLHSSPKAAVSLHNAMQPKDATPSPSSLAEAVGLDLNAVGKAEARKIMSEEHKALGFRPPHGSLASEAQTAADKHPNVSGAQVPSPQKLKEAAVQDAARILAERLSPGPNIYHTQDCSFNNHHQVIDLSMISEDDARKLMSHEHRALGYRPPPGSLAAEAQAAASKHPNLSVSSRQKVNVRDEVLKEAAEKDAERIKAIRVPENSNYGDPRTGNDNRKQEQVYNSRHLPRHPHNRKTSRSHSQPPSTATRSSSSLSKASPAESYTHSKSKPKKKSSSTHNRTRNHPSNRSESVSLSSSPPASIPSSMSPFIPPAASTPPITSTSLPPFSVPTSPTPPPTSSPSSPASSCPTAASSPPTFIPPCPTLCGLSSSHPPPPTEMNRSETSDSVQIIGDVLS